MLRCVHHFKMDADIRLTRNIFWSTLLFFSTITCWTVNAQALAPRFRRPIIPDRITFVNDNLELLCKVKGNPKPFVVWYHNSSLLESTERVNVGRKSMKISNVHFKDAGMYQCRASNEHGEIWGNFSVKVYENPESIDLIHDTHGTESKSSIDMCDGDGNKGPPVWTRKHDDTTFLAKPARHDIKINCDARGYPWPNITWYKNSQKLTVLEGKYSMEGWTMTVSELAMKDQANYTCVLQNECGSIRWTYTLEVIKRIMVAPIIDDIDNVTVVKGQNAVFTCKILVSDSQPLLQWLRHYKVNGSFVDENDQPYVHRLQQSGSFKTIDDPQSLTIENATEEDEGWYTCLVANSVGMNYRSGWLTVLNALAPRFRRPIIPYRITFVNDNLELLCKVKGNPKPFVVWYHNSSVLESTERVNIGRNSMKISNVHFKDAGMYQCRASNEHGEIWGNFSVKVYEALGTESKSSIDMCDGGGIKGRPFWTRKHDYTTFLAKPARHDIKINCDARGYPRPNITWYKNSQKLNVLEGKYSMEGWTMTISELAMKDQANYTCVLQNECGSIRWTYTLEVDQRILVAPIIDDINNVTVVKGQNAVFTCKILVSDSQPLLQWLRHYKVNGSFVDENDQPYVHRLQGDVSLSNQSGILKTIDDPQSLTIENATEEYEGWYTCLVANAVGMNYRSAWLTVLNGTESNSSIDMCDGNGIKALAPRFRRPIIPDRITFVNDNLELLCKVKGNPKPFVVWYHNSSVLESTERVNIGRKSMKISNVHFKDAGMYQCRASNEHGEIWGDFSVKVYENPESIDFIYDTHGTESKSSIDMCDGDGIKGPPVWTRKHDDNTFLAKPARHDIKINCDGYGYPRPNITWYKNSQKLNVLEGKYSMEGWTMTVSELAMKDQANYTCVLQNECGSIRWTFTLEVIQRILVAPIIDDINNVTVVKGQNAVFTCKILVSDSQPLLQWLRHYKVNGSFVDENDQPYVQRFKQSGLLKTIDDPQSLTIENATEEDEGWYTCLVANSVGMNYRSAWLTVLNESLVDNSTLKMDAVFGNLDWL